MTNHFSALEELQNFTLVSDTSSIIGGSFHDFPNIPNNLKLSWVEDGFIVLKSVCSPDQVSKYNSIVEEARASIGNLKDSHGLGDRIGQLHQRNPELLNILSDHRVMDFIKWAFNDDPYVMGSLNFEKGTQQESHVDAIFFWPSPHYSMCGCWIALEDIHEDSGPLFYLPGSHRWPFFRSEDLARVDTDFAKLLLSAKSEHNEQKSESIGKLGLIWSRNLLNMEKLYGTNRIPVTLKAGDAVIWHSLLAHGGMPVANPTLSRKSVAFHFMGQRSKLYTNEQFFIFSNEDLLNEQPFPIDLAQYGNIPYSSVNHFVSYEEGVQKIHKLSK